MTTTTQRQGAADILTIGFGTAGTMWGVGYVCRLFGDAVPAVLLFTLLQACLLGGGIITGRWTTRGVRGGLYVGAVAGLVNLLIVGSLLGGETPREIRSGALIWVPGTLVVSMLLGAVGAALGRLRRRATTEEPDWPGGLAWVTVGAAFLLLMAGGLVTGFDEGLAVVDWPNTEGYNMFLYPLARMTGGVYLEHAHRLLGTLVGLTTLVLTLHVQLSEMRRGLKGLAWLALLLVIIQGVLGGLRVTGRLTLSTQPADTDPSIILAIVHGVLGQIVFATLVGVAVCRGRTWSAAAAPVPARGAGTDRGLGIALIVMLIVQLVLGALVRHFTWALGTARYGLEISPERLAKIGQHTLMTHITFAVIVAVCAVAAGVRAWGLYGGVPRLRGLGRQLLMLTLVQLVLGIAALIVTGDDAADRRPLPLDVAVTTAHQVVGAALLGWSVMLVLWNYRLLAPPPAVAASRADATV